MIIKSSKILSVNRLLICLFIFSCFFPCVTFLPSVTDSQPYAFIFSLLLMFLYFERKIIIDFFYLFIVVLYSVLLLFFHEIDSMAIRSLYCYMSMFFISYITYRTFHLFNDSFYKIYKSIVFIWFIVGFIQTFIEPDFLYFLVARNLKSSSLSGGRGVISLMTEPAGYGQMCLCFIIIGYLNFEKKYKMKLIYFLLIIQLIFFAKSSTYIFVFIVSFVLFYFYKIIFNKDVYSIAFIFILLLLFYFVLPIVLDSFLDYRIGYLLRYLFNNPSEFIASDGSGQIRICHIIFSFYGFIENYGMPHGYGMFFPYLDSVHLNYSFSETVSTSSDNVRILSNIGSVLFELGIIGLIPFYILIRSFCKLRTRDVNVVFVLILFLILLTTSALFSLAIIPFVFGNVIYLSHRIEVCS